MTIRPETEKSGILIESRGTLARFGAFESLAMD